MTLKFEQFLTFLLIHIFPLNHLKPNKKTCAMAEAWDSNADTK